MSEPVMCSQCGHFGGVLEFMGTLGRRDAYRCRDCGLDHLLVHEPEPVDDDEDDREDHNPGAPG